MKVLFFSNREAIEAENPILTNIICLTFYRGKDLTYDPRCGIVSPMSTTYLVLIR